MEWICGVISVPDLLSQYGFTSSRKRFRTYIPVTQHNSPEESSYLLFSPFPETKTLRLDEPIDRGDADLAGVRFPSKHARNDAHTQKKTSRISTTVKRTSQSDYEFASG